MVWACARARSRDTSPPPAPAITSKTRMMRKTFILVPPFAVDLRAGAPRPSRKAPNPSTRDGRESTCAAARGDQPLESPPPLGRGRGRACFEDVEVGRKHGLDVGARHRERRAVGSFLQGIEAGEQNAPGREDVPEDLRVFHPALGVDGAEARVFPHCVERRGEVRAQPENVALLEGDPHALVRGEPACLAHRGLGEVEGGDLIAAAGEEARVVATPGPRHRDASARRQGEAGGETRHEGGCGLAQLPAVLARHVEPVPEGGRAYGRAIAGHSTCSKSATALSAPAFTSSSSVWAVVTPTARMPARRAACTPTSESSKTRQRSGAVRRRAAASRYTSGSGLPYVTSSAVTMTSK